MLRDFGFEIHEFREISGDIPLYNFPPFFFRGSKHESPRISSPPTGCSSSSPTDHISKACFRFSSPTVALREDDVGTSISTFCKCFGFTLVNTVSCQFTPSRVIFTPAGTRTSHNSRSSLFLTSSQSKFPQSTS